MEASKRLSLETVRVDHGGLAWSINSKNGEKWINCAGRMDGLMELMASRMAPRFELSS